MNRIISRKILLVVLCFFPWIIFAQTTGSISGKVIDNISRSPLPGATIVILDSDPLKGTSSNVDGNFQLEHAPLGRISLKISFLGYEPLYIRNIMVNSGKQLRLTAELQEKIIEAEAVEIKAKMAKEKPLNTMASVSARSFSVEESNRYAGSLGDPSRMAANYAGVMTMNDSRNDIIIRGNTPAGLLWRLNGIDIPNPNHFGSIGTTGGPVSILNNNLLDNSDFFTSAFPAEYGNAISGVFDLNMRSGNPNEFEFTGQLGFNGFELGAEGPLGIRNGNSFLVNYRYSMPAVFDVLGFDMGTGSSVPYYQDISFKVDLQLNPKAKLSIFGLGGISNIKLYGSEKEDDEFSFGLTGTDTDFESDMGIAGIKLTNFLNKSTRLESFVSLQTSMSSTKIDSLRKENPKEKYPFFRDKKRENKIVAGTDLTRKINSKNNFKAGLEAEIYFADFIDSVYKHDDKAFETRNDFNGNMALLQAFMQWQHRFSDKLILNSGVHLQQFTLNASNAIEPRAGLKWIFHPNMSLNFGFGMHSMLQPHMYYFYETHLPGGTIIQTNKDMGFSRSLQNVLGFDYLITENFRLKIETYYQYLYDIPVKENFPEFSMLNEGSYFAFDLQDSLVNQGTGHNYGLEFTLEKFFSEGYYFLATTSLFNSKYRGYDDILRNTVYNGNFVLNLLGGYEFRIGENNFLAIDLKTVWAGGTRYTPIDLEKSIKENQTEYDYRQANSLKHNDYFKLDARISFKMNGKKFNQEWALDIKNLTNYQNIFQESYDPISGTIKTDYQQGFYTMILYRIQF